jgi:arabinan endo-1,5-alpha-L-arabinosidase
MPVTRFNGTGDYIDLGAQSLDMSEITFSAFVKWNGFNNWSRVWDFGVVDSGGDTDFLLANSGTSNSLVVAGRRKGGASLPDSTVGSLEINKWYYITVVVSKTTITTYISNDLKFK